MEGPRRDLWKATNFVVFAYAIFEIIGSEMCPGVCVIFRVIRASTVGISPANATSCSCNSDIYDTV